jgi:predicted metalloprotease with PDZ domain
MVPIGRFLLDLAGKAGIMIRIKLLLSFFLISWNGYSQIIYEVYFPNPSTHYIEVTMNLKGVPSDSLDVVMPVWIPGSYMVREFSRHVEGFRAETAEGLPLSFKKIRKNAWRIYHGELDAVSIHYRVYANELTVRTSFVDDSHAYINGTSVFMYADSMKYQAALINFHPWHSWNSIHTGLLQFSVNPWSRVAENYDQLADCPIVIGNPDAFSFEYQGIPHHIVMIGKAEYDKDKIKSDFYKIVDECTRIFGENPNSEYTFLIHNSVASGGGLEHTNSCSVITNRNSYENTRSYKGFLSLIAHEYLHLWSVKRIRPFALGPFDYNCENYTTQLWFFEGFTSYMDDYILYRTGFYSKADYLDIVLSNTHQVLNTPGDSIQSLSESSFDAWIKYYRPDENSRNSTVSYYTKGALLGALMDIDIIHSTGGLRSLDDVFHYLYHQMYKKMDRGITDEELMTVFNTISGKNYSDFFRKYIYGTETLPVDSILQLAGLGLERIDGRLQPTGYLGATFSQSGSRLLISQVERGSAAWSQGLNSGDEILGVDDKEPMQIRDYLSTKAPGEAVRFRILRGGVIREFNVLLGEPTTRQFAIVTQKKLSEQQKNVLEKWLPHD